MKEEKLEPKVSFGAVFASFFKKNKLGSTVYIIIPLGRIQLQKCSLSLLMT
jgi:hypothetical protein